MLKILLLSVNIFATMLLLNACSKSAPEFLQTELHPGGELTAKNLSQRSFIYPGKGVSRSEQLEFWTGFSLFRDPWVIAPSSTKDRDGLGPLFNTRSCVSCHDAGARAKITQTGEHIPSALVVRLSSNSFEHITLDPNYGGQIQPRAIQAEFTAMDKKPVPEAQLQLSYEEVKGLYKDGSQYTLYKPTYQLTRLGYGALAPHIGLSPRLAPNVFGMGLLDAIPEADLLAQEDPNDVNQDGISARYNRVPNLSNGKTELGRFGFKAKQPNLRQQVAAAFRDDIGITNTLFPNESCTKNQPLCKQASDLGEHDGVEIPDSLLELVTVFNQYLSVQPARGLTKKNAQQGREIFYKLNCNTCHQPSYTTSSDYPLDALANQTIWPYTDLALHDMGAELSDGTVEFLADQQEWRTPPLWGIGLQNKYTGQQRFLHDGRARTIEEAILWHGGEAQSAKNTFIQLSKQEREALILFLRAI